LTWRKVSSKAKKGEKKSHLSLSSYPEWILKRKKRGEPMKPFKGGSLEGVECTPLTGEVKQEPHPSEKKSSINKTHRGRFQSGQQTVKTPEGAPSIKTFG